MKRVNKPIYREIMIGGVPVSYELYRGTYKNINLRVRSDGSIRVSADRRVSTERIESFLLANEVFLLRARARAASPAEPEENPWREGGRIPVLGQDREIRVIPGSKGDVQLEEERLFVTVRAETEEEIRRTVLRWIEREAERLIPAYRPAVERLFAAYPIPAHRYRFRYMVSQWGSCCPSKRVITLNKYLMCVPPDCIEYVLVHETAHFLELNHSPAFWRIVETLLPDWRERKKRMKPYGIWLRKQ